MLQALDRVDKATSRPIFHAVLPEAVEYALSPVWIIHGCPVTALALCPWLVVGLSHNAFNPGKGGREDRGVFAWLVCTAIVICGFLWVWTRLVRSRDTGALYMHKQKSLMVALILLSLVAALAFDAAFDGNRLALVLFYLCAWFAAEAIVVGVKAIAGRRRPGVSLATELRGVSRALPELTYLHATGETAAQSFPSGDATGGAVFATCLTIVAGVPQIAAGVYAILVAFGRIYLWAHHLGDVIAGCVVGMMCTKVLDAAVGPENFQLMHLGVSVGLILPVYLSRDTLKDWASNVPS